MGYVSTIRKITFLSMGILFIFLTACDGEQNTYKHSLKTKFQYLSEEYAPLNYLKNGKPEGMAVDVIEAIAEELEIPAPDIKIQLWSETYETALSEPNVIIFSITRTPQREDKFYWLSPSVMRFEEFFYEKRGSEIQINSMDDAKKYTIGVTEGYYSYDNLKALDFKNLKVYKTQEGAVYALMNGEIDLIDCAEFRAEFLAKKLGYSISDILPVFKVADRRLYIAISKGTSQKAVKEWKKAFKEIRLNKTYYKIYKKWFMSHSGGQ